MLDLFGNSSEISRSLEIRSNRIHKRKEEKFAWDITRTFLIHLRNQDPSSTYRPVLFPDSEFVLSAGAVGLEKLSSFNIQVVKCGPGLFRKIFPRRIARLTYENFLGWPVINMKTYDRNLLPEEKARELMPTAKEVDSTLQLFRHSAY